MQLVQSQPGEINPEDDEPRIRTSVSLRRVQQLISVESTVTARGIRGQLWTEESRRRLSEQLRNSRAYIAVLLPVVGGPRSLAENPLTRAVRVRAVANTSFRGSFRRLWLLEWDSSGHGEATHVQLRFLRRAIEDATRESKPTQGPWIWPVHGLGVSVAVMLANVALGDSDIPRWRYALWYLRILPLPTGCNIQTELEAHYGSAVAYAFAWLNLYVQGLWILAFIAVLANVGFGAGPEDVTSARVIPWIILQVLTLLWAKVLADAGGHKRHELVSGDQALGSQELAAAAQQDAETASQQRDAPVRDSSQHALQSDIEEARRREALLVQEQAQAVPPRDGQLLARARWRRVLRVVSMGVGHTLRLRREQYNPAYRAMGPCQQQCRKILTPVLTLLAVSSFSAVCISVQTSFVQLNIYLIYVWGDCLDKQVRQKAAAMGQDCLSPQFEHGFVGWLADLGSDVALAISFDIGLRAASNALARSIASFRNFEWEHDRQRFRYLISLVLQGLSKVGMLVIVGFVFLPEWVKHESGSPVPQQCESLPIYKICKAIARCDTALEPDCCSNTLLCIAQQLDRSDRENLFQKSVKGPFVVAPFLRILVMVIIPWVANELEKLVTVGMRSDEVAARCGCLSCFRTALTPLVRMLALIFHVDFESVGGLSYLKHGWPFERLQRVDADDSAAAVEGLQDRVEERQLSEEFAETEKELLCRALDQVARRPFEPQDELLEIKMHLLFVAMFAPIMPLGIVRTLGARLLEVRFKATKLFFVRRRCWPGPATVLHTSQGIFARIVVGIATVWHTGLLLVSYNPHLPGWSATFIVGVWLATAAVVFCLVYVLSFLVRKLALRCRGNP